MCVCVCSCRLCSCICSLAAACLRFCPVQKDKQSEFSWWTTSRPAAHPPINKGQQHKRFMRRQGCTCFTVTVEQLTGVMIDALQPNMSLKKYSSAPWEIPTSPTTVQPVCCWATPPMCKNTTALCFAKLGLHVTSRVLRQVNVLF